jgi:GH24 family phage-related lysozyme (muramidase)
VQHACASPYALIRNEVSMQRKPIFDTVRKLLGRGFRNHEVRAIDTAIDAALGAPGVSAQESVTGVTCPRHPRAISPRGIALIQQFEGLAKLRRDGLVEAYPDPGSSLSRTGSGSGAPWTIGWGATGYGIGPDTVWTRAECDARLAADLLRYAADVDRALGEEPTTQAQFDALVSFHYNTGAIARATLTKKHLAGDFAGAASEFGRWNRAGGRVLSGLSRRRAAEAAFYSA